MTRQTFKSSRVRAFKPRSAGGTLSGILGAIAMSVIAGVLVTAAVTPVVALSGTTANTAIGIFESLPDTLDPGQLAEPSVLYATDSKGKNHKIAEFYDQDRETVAWNEISQYVKDAAVAEEDPRFYTHGGVDVLATARAVLQNVAGQNLSGASTITMQYVRNVLIQDAYAIVDEDERKAAYDEAMQQTMDRKLKEMKYAISIEKQYSKNDILLGYLNIALFGRQIYGIQSAANYYYSKDADELTLAEAASLVAIVNNPSLYQLDVKDNIPANKERRDKILTSMLSTGKITQDQYDEAVATEVEPDITPRVAGCSVAEKKYNLGHFCDYVQRYIKQDDNFGETAEERDFNFSRGGYKIYTTINLDMQKAGVDATQATVPAEMDGIDVGSASVSVEVGTGKVLAMVQNKPFSNDESYIKKHPSYTSINYNTDYEYGGSAGFQVGSTFKPVTLAEWIRTGHSVRDIVNVDGRTVDESSFMASCMPDGVYGFGSFTFSNDNLGTRGNQPVLTAIAQSVNGGLVSMQQQMDLCGTFDTAASLDLHRASKQTNEDLPNYGTTDLTMVPSNVYGGIDEMAPITMASAYAAFAGDGTVCTPVPIAKIKDRNGDKVPFTESSCTEGISAEVAAGVAYVLQYTVTNGLARHAASSTGVPHLAKTGTTDDVVDNWTVGASTKVATATWVGNAGPVKLADGTWGRVSTMGFGGLMYADQTIWPAIMNTAVAEYGGDPFPDPANSAIAQTMVTVPDLSGNSFDEAQKALTDLGFAVTDGGDVDSSVAKGRVARTDPDGGSEAAKGSGVTIYTSNGEAVKVPGGLKGGTADQAKSSLNASGFSNIEYVCSGSGKASGGNTVKSVSPSSGKEIKPTKTVTLTLDCR